jgi:hypothetical protein
MELFLEMTKGIDHNVVVTYWGDSESSGLQTITVAKNPDVINSVNISKDKKEIQFNLVEDFECKPGNVVFVEAVLTCDDALIPAVKQGNYPV